MAGHVMNLFVIMAVGVIIADLVIHQPGTKTLFSGLGNLWSVGVNGMLGTAPSVTPVQ